MVKSGVGILLATTPKHSSTCTAVTKKHKATEKKFTYIITCQYIFLARLLSYIHGPRELVLYKNIWPITFPVHANHGLFEKPRINFETTVQRVPSLGWLQSFASYAKSLGTTTLASLFSLILITGCLFFARTIFGQSFPPYTNHGLICKPRFYFVGTVQ